MDAGGVSGNKEDQVITSRDEKLVTSAKEAVTGWTNDFKTFVATKIDASPNRDLYLQKMGEQLNELKDIRRNILENHALVSVGSVNSQRLQQIANSTDVLRQNLERTVFIPTAALKELLEIDRSRLNPTQIELLDLVIQQIKDVEIGSNEGTRSLYLNMMSLVDKLKHDSIELKRVNVFIQKIEDINKVDFDDADQKHFMGQLSSVNNNLNKEEVSMTASHRGARPSEDSPKLVMGKMMEIYNDAAKKGSLSLVQVVRLEQQLELLKPPTQEFAVYQEFQKIPLDQRKSNEAQAMRRSVDPDVWTFCAHYTALKETVEELKGRFS